MKDNNKLNEQKRKLGSLLSKNLIVISVAIIVALTGVIAWFTRSQTAPADGVNVKCEVPDGLEVAVVAPGATPTEDDYKKSLLGDINLNKEDYPFLENLEFVEVTSDGVEFVKPALIQGSDGAYPNTDPSSEWSLAEPNKEYLCFDLYMRMNSSNAVYLDGDTTIKPVSDTLIGPDSQNKSEAGNFSRDCLVGAARMSVTGGTAGENILWIPAPNIFYDSASRNMYIDRTSGDSFTHSYYTSGKVLKTAAAIANTGNTYKLGKSAGKNRKIADLIKSGDKYVAHRRISVWIEGQDDESRFALVNGFFKMQLKLSLNQ
ncbi:MAG: hypothetical protein J1F17_02570 [Oscillospiraceae bacterium]|nr:hypothetical protein [Oscillospiraceae bacterium]